MSTPTVRLLLRRATRARRAATTVAAIPLAALLSSAGCSDSDPSASASAPGAERVLLVDMAPVRTRDISVTLDAVGTAYASGMVDIRPQVGGTLMDAPFVEGDPAEEGQVLVRLDDTKARASLALSEAQLDSARAKLAVATERLGRFRRLATEDLVSREEFATLESEQKAAAAAVREHEAAVRLAQRNLEDYTLRAPISGRMGIRYVDTGNYVEAGTVIATLVATDPLEVLFTVPSTAVRDLAVGQKAEIRDTDPGGTLLGTGRVRVIDPKVDTDTRMVSLKAVVSNPDGAIQAGQFVGVTLLREQRRDAVVVPEDAVIPSGGRTYAFVVRDGRVERREVRLGVRLPKIVEITSGLAAGDVIVTRGQHRLADGSKVEQSQAPTDKAPPLVLPDAAGRG